MTDLKNKTTRLSIKDFDYKNKSLSESSGIIYMDGHEFPEAFTYNNPGILDGVSFGVCTGGNVTVKINSKIYNIAESTVIVIMPNHIVEPIESSEDFTLKLLVLSLDYVSNIKLDIEAVKRLEDNPCVDVSAADSEILTDMFLIVNKLLDYNENRSNDTALFGMLETIVFKLESIIANSASLAEATKVSRAEEFTRQFLKMVIVHYKEFRSLNEYANELYVSPKYLTQVVRETTGETPFKWINKIVMIGAKNLIRTKDASILQISEELNFPNPSFFNRYFKKHSGMTPLEFRRNH